jgi:hypothetical protein
MDSIRLKIDSISTSGFTVITKTHFSSFEFNSKITFKDSMPPRLDSIYKYMKSLRPGSTVLVNLGYNGGLEISPPDSTTPPKFIIEAFPCPLQYTGK